MNLNLKNVSKIALVAVVVYLLALSTVMVKADLLLETNPLYYEVTIDGVIETDEWTGAKKNEIQPFIYGMDLGNAYVYLGNDEEFLYMLIDSPGMGSTMLWIIGIDADHDGNWTPNVDMNFLFLYNETAETKWTAIVQVADETYAQWKLLCVLPNETVLPGAAFNASIGTSADISVNHPIIECKVPLDLIGIMDAYCEGGDVGVIYIHVAQTGSTINYLNWEPESAKWTDDNGKPVEGAIATWGALLVPPACYDCCDGNGWLGEVEGPPYWIWPVIGAVAAVVVIVVVYVVYTRLRH